MRATIPGRWTWAIVWLSGLAVVCAGCERGPSAAEAGERSELAASNEPSVAVVDLVVDSPDARIAPSAFRRRYPWRLPAGEWPGIAPLSAYVRTPEAFERVEVESGSFGEFLRELPVRLDRAWVKAYDGRRLPSPAAGVVAMPMVDGNLQQCADSVLRLYAEYLWETERRGEIDFHFTSGDRSTWSGWQAGERFRIDGADVERYDGKPRDDDRETLRGYLRHLFTYAGTQSLPMDARRLDVSEPTRPGDMFLESGSPGHVVVVLDVATKGDGERVALIGQGFMPAQEFHLVEGPGGRVWFQLPDEGELLNTPSWEPFGRDDRWRFE